MDQQVTPSNLPVVPPAKKPRRLTMKQDKFVKAYIANGGNGTQAALQVYDVTTENSKHVANVIASENLTKPVVLSRLEQLQQENEERLQSYAKEHDAFGKAVQSALNDLNDPDPKARDSARKFLEVIRPSNNRSQNVTNDNRKVTIKYPTNR